MNAICNHFLKIRKRITGKYKLRYYVSFFRSTNSATLGLRSASPSTDSKQQNLVISSCKPSGLNLAVDEETNGYISAVSDSKPTKRESLSDVQADLTPPSNKNALRQVCLCDGAIVVVFLP